MGRRAGDRIEKGQNLELFVVSAGDIAAKDQMDLMSRCWFSLTPGRIDPIEHQFLNRANNRTETVRITGSAEYGIATIHDNDLIIFAISQWVDAKSRGYEPSRRISFTPYQYFTWMDKAPHGTAYARLKDTLRRLKTTTIETSIRSTDSQKGRLAQFSWISEWRMDEDKDGRARGVEVVLAEWLFESIQQFDVLTLDKRYFQIHGSIERWLYLHARKATGGLANSWKESFRSLHSKSAGQQEYKHYALALRKLIAKNNLPGLKLSLHRSARGEEMLGMERTEKTVRKPRAAQQPELPLQIVEELSRDEAWENAFAMLSKQVGLPTANSWFKKLEYIGQEDGVLTLMAPTRFHADWVASHYSKHLRTAWSGLGQEIVKIQFLVKGEQAAA